MLRFTLVIVMGLLSASPGRTATWAEALFDGLDMDFGTVPQGKELTHPFCIKNKTDQVVSISGIRVSCGRCGYASLAKWQLKPGEETALVGKMYTSNFMGPKTIWLYVQFSQPQVEEVRLSLQANSRSDVTLAPDNLAFGPIPRGTNPTASTAITFSENGQVRITGVDTGSKKIQATLKETQRTDSTVTYRLTARLQPTLGVGDWWAEIWLKTDSPNIPRLRIPLSVTVEPALKVTPSAVSLGQIQVGTTVERKITLRGTKPFLIKEMKGADNQLEVQETTAGNRPVHVLIVRLKGTTPGNLSRTIHIITDMKDETEATFQASAEVIP